MEAACQGPNPLVLHGPVGTGKTHLLEGIYAELRKRRQYHDTLFRLIGHSMFGRLPDVNNGVFLTYIDDPSPWEDNTVGYPSKGFADNIRRFWAKMVDPGLAQQQRLTCTLNFSLTLFVMVCVGTLLMMALARWIAVLRGMVAQRREPA